MIRIIAQSQAVWKEFSNNHDNDDEDDHHQRKKNRNKKNEFKKKHRKWNEWNEQKKTKNKNNMLAPRTDCYHQSGYDNVVVVVVVPKCELMIRFKVTTTTARKKTLATTRWKKMYW